MVRGSSVVDAPSGCDQDQEQPAAPAQDATDLDGLDRALRHAAAWWERQALPTPAVRVIRLHTGAIELFAATPARMPDPWQQADDDGCAWSLEADAVSTLDAGRQPPPWPALVAVGEDVEGGLLLVDLAAVGDLGVAGEPCDVWATLAALAAELATSPWASDLQVVVHDDLEDVARLVDDQHRIATTARGPGPNLLVTTDRDAGALPAGTIAVAHAGTGTWSIDLKRADGPGAVLTPIGLPVAAQQLQHDQVRDALAAVGKAPTDDLDSPAMPLEHLEVTVGDLLHVAAAAASGQVAPAPGWGQPVLGEHDPVLPTPTLRVLGDIALHGPAGTTLDSNRQGQALELIALLALRPGVDHAQVSQSLWPTREPVAATRNSVVSRARKWLGQTPTGAWHLPVVADTGRYELNDVHTDWHLFTEKVGNDPAEASTAALVEALALVRGRPLASRRPGKYTWADDLQRTMTGAICDVAHELATRSLRYGDLSTARRAAEIAVEVDAADERAWRNLLRTERAADDTSALRSRLARLHDHLRRLQLDPDRETADLVEELVRGLRASA